MRKRNVHVQFWLDKKEAEYGRCALLELVRL